MTRGLKKSRIRKKIVIGMLFIRDTADDVLVLPERLIKAIYLSRFARIIRRNREFYNYVRRR